MRGRLVEWETDGRVAVISLNRPERHNALTQDTWNQLDEALERFASDRELWAAVLTGVGTSFCAGADLEDIDRTGVGEEAMQPPARFSQLALGGIWKPIVGAIRGYALAGGFWLAQSCDVRIAGESAQFGLPETRFNLRLDFIGELTRLVGLGHACEIAMWGDRRIPATRAYEMGLVNEVVPDEQVLATALDWAHRATRLGPRSVANAKEILYRTWGQETAASHAFARELAANLTSMEDTREGPRAFLEKREPRYRNA